MCPKGRGCGLTPPRVKELLVEAVSKSSQAAVARESGITRLNLQRYLKGIGEPTTATLQKLADYFGVSVAYLRGEEPELGSDTLEFVSESFNNIDLPSQVTDQVGLLILSILVNGFQRLSNKEGAYNAVFQDAINKYIRIINILAPYYKHQGALGDDPYRNNPHIDSEYLLFQQLKGLMELDVGIDPAENTE
jgi:transcriptional regulator with XRE-family HTH domain